jgi:hypothetical protein
MSTVAESAAESVVGRCAGIEQHIYRTPLWARVWPYLAASSGHGGKDATPADRQFGSLLWEAIPEMVEVARRRCVGRAALSAYLTASGIEQFLVAGTDYPTQMDVHHVVGCANPEARTVYADADPLVTTYARALHDPRLGHFAVVDTDPTKPAELLEAADRYLDLTRPVGVLFVTTLDLLLDEAATAVIGGLAEQVAPGSALGVVQLGPPEREDDGAVPAALEILQALAAEHHAPVPHPRGPRAIVGMFGPGLRLVAPPGVTDALIWFDDFTDFPAVHVRDLYPGRDPDQQVRVWCAVARTPGSDAA